MIDECHLEQQLITIIDRNQFISATW